MISKWKSPKISQRAVWRIVLAVVAAAVGVTMIGCPAARAQWPTSSALVIATSLGVALLTDAVRRGVLSTAARRRARVGRLA